MFILLKYSRFREYVLCKLLTIYPSMSCVWRRIPRTDLSLVAIFMIGIVFRLERNSDDCWYKTGQAPP